MTQTESNGRNDLATKEHEDRGCKILKDNTTDTNNTGDDDCLLSSDEITDNTRHEGRGENTNRVCRIENLLVRRFDDICAIDLISESLGEWRDGQELAHHGDFIAEVDGEEIDDEAWNVSE